MSFALQITEPIQTSITIVGKKHGIKKHEKVSDSGKKADCYHTVEPIRDPEKLAALRRYFHDKYDKTNNISMKQKHLRNHLIFIIGTNTALRISDILRLSWKDLLKKNKMFIKEHKTKKWNSKIITDDMKTAITEYYTFCADNGYETADNYYPFIYKFKSSITDYKTDCLRAEKAYIKVLKDAAKNVGINLEENRNSLFKKDVVLPLYKSA